MTSNDLIHALQLIDDSYISESAPVSEAAKHPHPHRRTVLFAACISLILLGSVLSVSVLYPLSSTVNSSASDVAYTVDAGITKYPFSSFSSALQTASETRGSLAVVQLEFDSLSEVREFIGPSINLSWPSIDSWQGKYSVNLFHTDSDRLWAISIESFDPQHQTSISSTIFTEHYPSNDSATLPQIFTSESFVKMSHPHEMLNGLSADVILVSTPEKNALSCIGTFTNGSVCSVEVYGALSDQRSALNCLYKTLDAFP